MRKAEEVDLLERNTDIVQANVDGLSLREIAEKYDLSLSRVNTVITDALKEARKAYEDTANELWVKNFIRTEKILEKLTEIAFDEAKPPDEQVNWAALDRIERYITLQNKMLISYKDKMNDNSDKGGNTYIFHSGSDEYLRMLSEASKQPKYLPTLKVIDADITISSSED